MSFITIKGARSHNLKNISAKIPRGKLVTITGVSGSGKSSLAFDTLFAEGQRRFMQSLSAYARQFVEQLEKPDVDFMDGLSPSISLDQKTFYRNPRSTVGTITEIYDFMRLLFARVGKPMCHRCGEEISPQTAQAMAKRILSSAGGEEVTVMSQVVRGRKGFYRKEIEDLKREGFVRAFIDGEERDLDEEIVLDRNKTHNIEVIVDTVGTSGAGARKRLEDSLTLALKKSGGSAVCAFGNKTMNFSETFSCPSCGEAYGEISPRIFSFNSPYGMCGECSGLGIKTDFDPELIVDSSLSIRDGAIKPWKNSRYHKRLMEETAEYYGFSTDVPFEKLPSKARSTVLYGNGNADDFPGVIGALSKWRSETSSSEVESGLAEYMKKGDCPSCGGARLRRESLSVFVNQKTIYDISRLDVEDSLRFFTDLKFRKYETEIGGGIVEEIKSRIGFLKDIGLGYIALDRSAATLSGGEAQRIRLATQLGSKMTGVTYVLDEPSIGLHPSDNDKLICTLKTMRDNGNTIVVVEHDEDMIRNSDFVLDMGPEAGRRGGEITGFGTVRELISCEESLTGKYLSGKEKIDIPLKRRRPEEFITLKGAAKRNLAGLDVSFPVGAFTCITGVSGSGKSTLLHETLCPAIELARRGKAAGGGFKAVCGARHTDKVVKIDQMPIGRTPRSNPATYTGIFSPIRELFAMTPEAKLRGYGTGRFSFNVREGSCGLCGGKGSVKVEMHFLPDVYTTCERCGGKRFESETLEITYRDKNISDVLQMTVSEAAEFFSKHPQIKRKLDIIEQVGLGYVSLGQEANTLSGGEAQRIKIARELSQKETGKTLYVLDEPSIGLHFNDVKKLLAALEKLIQKGNTVIVIEHNMDIIKSADYVIDLGPGGGKNGGKIVAKGRPEELARAAKSLTGKYLKKALGKKRRD
ncbi:MAG: excinuclease ABC subunit UvrA [Candidatus Mycalebacterium zealandia]|nr:MAG: excinuclease ABC subunit UvrA [Candidatus Mycalebacterium zealandia]